MAELWAVLEHRDGELAEQSHELLAGLLEIAQQQLEQPRVLALVLCATETHAPELSSLMTNDSVQFCLITHPELASYTTEYYVAALALLIRQQAPRLVVASATANGRDWMPRLAARLQLPYLPNCLSLDLQPDALLALRAIYEQRAYVQTRTVLRQPTALATLTPGTRGALKGQAALTTQTPPLVKHLAIDLAAQARLQTHVRHLGIRAPSAEEVELEAAQKIVAGGRGIGQEGFVGLAAFAHQLGAAVGATRVATDRGWIEHERQIGATGKSVHPRLYIACGISGAAQHTSGIREAQTIIAINPDRSAPIFALADLGLLGDANQILPQAARLLTEESI